MSAEPDDWRSNLPRLCQHPYDAERNPERRPALCLPCRDTAGDPYARRILAQRLDIANWRARNGGPPTLRLIKGDS